MLYIKYIQLLSKKKDIFILLKLNIIIVRNKEEKLFIRKLLSSKEKHAWDKTVNENPRKLVEKVWFCLQHFLKNKEAIEENKNE